MVRDNTFWEAMEFPDVMKKESGYSFHCDHCVCQNKVYSFRDRIVMDVWSRSGVTRSGVELLWSGRELITKMEKQPWPQLVHCASICCRVCGCVFQGD